eukprot:scaffold1377_cov390-Prasinococcus_capsulatus_cf.AAC.7
MKFGKHLRTAISEVQPEWQSQFLCYKELKKMIQNIPTLASVEGAQSLDGMQDSNAPADDKERGKENPSDAARTEEADDNDKGEETTPNTTTTTTAAATADGGVAAASTAPPASAVPLPVREAEADFIQRLVGEINKFNNFFVDKEEESIIRLQRLTERANAKDLSQEECKQVHDLFVATLMAG